MLRASLPDRRCIRYASSHRWLQHRSSGGSSSGDVSRGCDMTQKLNWVHQSINCQLTIRPILFHTRASNPHRHLSSRPKPFYDFENEDDESSENDWAEQGPSSVDNFSKYDNYSQYESSSGGNGEESSLLDLLSRHDSIQTSHKHEDASMMHLFDEKKNAGSDSRQPHSFGDVHDNSMSDQSPSINQPDLFGDLDFSSYRSQDPMTLSQHSSSQPNMFGPDLNFSPDYSPTIKQHDSFGPEIDFTSDHQHADITSETYDEAPLTDFLQEQHTNQSKYEHLQRLQLQLEIESSEEAIAKNISVWKSARERSDHSTIPVIRNELSSWYASLTAAIELEQWMYLNGDNKSLTSSYLGSNGQHVDTVVDAVSNDDGSNHGSRGNAKKSVARDRTVYGPLLCLLPPQKIAILLAHTALSSTVADGDDGTKVVVLAMKIAQSLETEINVSRALRVRASKQRAKLVNPIGDNNDDDELSNINIPQTENDATKKVNTSEDSIGIDKWVYTATHLQRFLDEISNIKSGSQQQKLQAGKGRIRPDLVRKRCQDILLAEGFVQDKGDAAANRHLSMNEFAEWDPIMKVKLGAALIQLLLDHTIYSKSGDPETGEPEPAFIHSRKKQNNGMRFQAFVSVHPDLLHLAMKAELDPNSMLSSPRFMQNSRSQPMVVPPKDWKSVSEGGYEALKVDFMRTRQCKTQKDAIRNADLTKVFEGLNVLGRIPWKVNKNVLDVALKCWENGIVLGDIPAQTDYDVPDLPLKLEYTDLDSLEGEEREAQIRALKTYKDGIAKHFRFKQKNMDLHSLRCSAMLKLVQAKKFVDFEEIFFPYNVDFRGRAYPVPPHLSIVGSDLCRALLMFAHPKALGPNGLYWLKVHLANLAGADKMSFDGRAQFADDNMENIRAAVTDPLGGKNSWWMEFDDPFQGLATCHEIVQAIDSGDPANYMCSLPVHMDGSCNGLQHYAALGRDKVGGKAVNLCVAEKPQDVYSGVMKEVIRRVALDAEVQLPFDVNKNDLSKSEKEQVKKLKSAQLVNGLIDRGVVKRTVMTSVYGVTYIGAKNQISEKIEEKLEEMGHDIDELEQEIHMACGYLASLTMEVMGQLFTGARQTMNWLTACARLISAQGQPVAFVSPIGVPVVQPYRQKRPVTVVTLLQNVVLTYDSDVLPLHRQRQVSAFPPNYVHSLDSSHMLLTAIEMQKRGLYFSAVHDSYWTHPCDIEELNHVLRESFIELYEQPLLEDLKRRWEFRYPSITFPDLPECGDLDLNDVRSAPYFFQ